MTEKPGKSAVPALDRGLDVLETMANSAGAHTLTEIARALGRTVSEVQRTVAQLSMRGYLVRDERGAYRLSSKLFRMATAFPPFRDLVSRASGPMQEFADGTQESVHLCVLTDDLLLLVGQVEGRGVVRVSLQLGVVQDPLTTVSGRILLAGLPLAELSAFLERRHVAAKERTRLEQALARVRKDGHEHAESSRVQGVQDLGVPVTLPGGAVIAALTTSWLPARGSSVRFAHLLAPLNRAAHAIAAAYEPSAAAVPASAEVPKTRGRPRQAS